MLKKLFGIFKRKKPSLQIDNTYIKFISFLIDNDVLHEFSVALLHSRDEPIYVYIDKYKHEPHSLIKRAFNWEATIGGADVWRAIDCEWRVKLSEFLTPAENNNNYKSIW